MFHRFNERAREAIERATRRAKELRHAVVEPEHILASLADTGEGTGGGETSFHSLLKHFDVPARTVADSLEAVPGPAGSGLAKEPVFSPEAKRVLEFAVDEADRLGHKRIGTSHFLLAFIRDELEPELNRKGERVESAGGARQTLTSLGLSLDDVRSRVRELSEGEAAGRADVVPAILFFELDRRAKEAEQALRTRVEQLEVDVRELKSQVKSLIEATGPGVRRGRSEA